MSERQATGVPPIAEATVAQLAQISGFVVEPQRLAAVTDRLRDLYQLAVDLDGLDLTGIVPTTDYDPTWPVDEKVVTA